MKYKTSLQQQKFLVDSDVNAEKRRYVSLFWCFAMK